MNPTTLRRVYDNEFLLPAGEDALTLPELMDTVGVAVWMELDKMPNGKASNREPTISSLRRNLQREYMERLIDLSLGQGSGASGKVISNLAHRQAPRAAGQDRQGQQHQARHLFAGPPGECKLRITKALDAQYNYNGGGGGGGFPVSTWRDHPATGGAFEARGR
jgi:hypothetical protein